MRISSHDFYTYVHSLNVCTLCVGLGSAIGIPKKPDLEYLALGGMLHDIGKSQVDSRLINKPGRLTEEEFAQMRLLDFITRRNITLMQYLCLIHF